MWFWGSDINLIFWRRDSAGYVIGAECNRARLLSDIVAQLPDGSPANPHRLQGRIALLDSKGNSVYHWGEFSPLDGARPQVTLPLSPPLTQWKLCYFVPSSEFDKPLAGGLAFNLMLGISALALVLGGLAFYFYRESSREIRTAAQRVSFVNQVSHELKTPLTNIRMYAELLEGNLAEDDKEAQRYLGVIVSESQRLSRLIANVLTFARQQKGALKLHKTAGCVDAVVASTLERFKPSFEAKGIAVDYKSDAAKTVSFDHDALEQILSNLFSNVEKYAASGGRI